MALLAGGATDAQIAGPLVLPVNMPRLHLERIGDKTDARRRTELVRYAIQAGIDPAALHLRAAPGCLDVTGFLVMNGPIGPPPPCSMGPSGPSCQVPAGRRLGLLLRHRGGTGTKGGTHGIDAKNTLSALLRR